MDFVGLNNSEIIKLQKKYGKNIIPEKEKNSGLKILISQFLSSLMLLLFVIALISIYFQEYFDAGLIFLVIIFNSLTGFFQEYSAEKTLKELKKIIKQKSFVIRNGRRIAIESEKLLPGDLVVLNAGDKIPADGIMIEGLNLLINEATLTGESEALEKSTDKKSNKLFMGTTVESGRAIMLVESIGTSTNFGRIAKSISEIEKEATPLQLKLKQLTKNLIILVIIICIVIFLVSIFKGTSFWVSLRTSIILSIAAIPEGLPIAITVILALGMRRILHKKGLIKKMLSIETLGSASTICIDKTGTITEGKMKIKETFFTDKKLALRSLILLNDRRQSMELAIWQYLDKTLKISPEKTFDKYKRIFDDPFDSEKKHKIVTNEIDNTSVSSLMGAPEIVLDYCKISKDEREKTQFLIKKLAAKGMRLLGLAYKDSGTQPKNCDYSWLGLIAVNDPIRKEAKEAIALAYKAGIDIKIVTGDYRITAENIAKNVGMNLKNENIMEATELEKISMSSLRKKIKDIKLFTRVTPFQKLKIIEALQKNGEIVAMTGDGINDAPALKKANIGIVVENGTDVAKEAGNLILLDSNFKTILDTCKEGRLILHNIKKVVGYVLSNSFAEIIIIFGAMILGFPAPLTIAQILFMHLICDGPPDIMLGFEPEEKDIMKLKPKEIQKEKLLPGSMKLMIFLISSIEGILGLIVFLYFNYIQNDYILARSIVFASSALVSMIYIFSFKDLNRSIFKMGNIFNNKYLNWSVIYGFVLIFIAFYFPFFNKILEIKPISFLNWCLVITISLIITSVIETVKWVKNRRNSY